MEDKVNYISPETMKEVILFIPRLRAKILEPEDIEMLYKILYYCALRPTEGIYLKKTDFNLKDREISLGNTKTRKNDFAPIPTIFMTELEIYLEGKRDGRLFPKLQYITFYRWLKKTGKALNIKAWTVHRDDSNEFTVGHLWRKTVGKDMLSGMYGEKAQEIPIISKHLRHKKPSMTIDYYLKASIEAVKEAW